MKMLNSVGAAGLASGLADMLLAPSGRGSRGAIVAGLPSDFLFETLRPELEHRGRHVSVLDLRWETAEQVDLALEHWFLGLVHEARCRLLDRRGVFASLQRHTGKPLALLIEGAEFLLRNPGGRTIHQEMYDVSRRALPAEPNSVDLVVVQAVSYQTDLGFLDLQKRRGYEFFDIVHAADVARRPTVTGP